MNGMAGALLTEEVLGLGAPMESTKHVRIAPHPGDLAWARGAAKCSDGLILLHWTVDRRRHALDMTIYLPDTWTYTLELPRGWQVTLNGEEVS